MKQIRILSIDDELGRDPDHKLRVAINEFAAARNYKAIFAEAPQSSEEIEAFLSHHRPSVIFLDIQHEDRPASIAQSIRTVAGSLKIPVLVISSYTKEEWELKNKQEVKRADRLDDYSSQLEKIKDRYESKIDELSRGLRDGRVEIEKESAVKKITAYCRAQVKKVMRIERSLSDYKAGREKKADIIIYIDEILREENPVKSSDPMYSDLTETLNRLFALLKSQSMPAYLKIYPEDLRRTIGYVQKITFNQSDVQEMIAQGIAATAQEPKISLEISGNTLKIEDDQGYPIVEYKSSYCDLLKQFQSREDAVLLESSPSECSSVEATDARDDDSDEDQNGDENFEDEVKEKKIHLSRKIASDKINKDIKTRTAWRIPRLLQKAGKKVGRGKYILDVAKFVVDGVTRWDDIKAKKPSPEDAPATPAVLSTVPLDDVWSVINELKQQISVLSERLSKLEPQ